MNETMIQLIGYGVLLFFFIAFIVYLYIINKDKKDGSFETFLNSIKEEITNTVITTINSYMENHDVSNTKLEELEKMLLDNIYDNVLKLIKCDLIHESQTTGDASYMNMVKILDKAITRDKVMSYIRVIIDEDDTIQDKIMDLYNIAYKEEAINVEKADKELEDFYKENLIENVEDYPEEEIDTTISGDPEEVIDPFRDKVKEVIIPPKDEDDNIFDKDIDEEI